MKKLIRIEFELKNPQEVIIYGYDEDLNKKEIGCVFSPAGSGEHTINAIQICGCKEAYDFWGCARYKSPATSDEREKINYALEGKKVPMIQTKDIQLLFDVETVPNGNWDEVDLKGCVRCYNTPCTCDNQIDEQERYSSNGLLENYGKPKPLTANPYNLKRAGEVELINKTDDLGDYAYLDEVLIKKSNLNQIRLGGKK